MPKVRSAWPEPKAISYGLPGERLIQPDEVFEVPEQCVYSYTLQPQWEAADADAERAHAAGKKAEADALFAERERRGEFTEDDLKKIAAAEKAAAKKGDA